jgi:hypothetical protein
MKKSKGFICVCTTLLIVMLASCTSQEEDNNLEATDVGAVRIAITQDEDPETRGGAGISDKVGTKTLNIAKGGHLFFVNASGNITKYVQILPTGGDNNTTVGLTTLTEATGATITNVPSPSKKVHIFLNLPASINTGLGAVGAPFSAIQSKIVTAVHLGDPAKFGVDSIPVSGTGDLTGAGTLTATVNLTAMASRIEIVKISTKANSAGVTIKSFNLLGIFINNYYPTATLGGTLGTIQNAGSTTANYDATNTVFFWRDATVGITQGKYLYTTHANAGTAIVTSSGSPANVVAGSEKVWGYNVFPNTVDNAVPHIILTLTNVVYNYNGQDTNIPGTQYVTVKGFKNTSNVAITKLARGVVYQLGGTSAAFEISPDDITDEPETTSISAVVKASVIPWSTQAVTPSY